MAKRLLFTKVLPILAMLLSLTLGTKAQTFTETTPPEVIDVYDDTLKFWLHNLPAGAWGNATITVSYEGDFGDNVEYIDFYGPGDVYMGTVGPYVSGQDCSGVETQTLTFSAAFINPLLPADSILIRGLPTIEVDPGNCNISQASIEASYNYCPFGTPQQIANFTFPQASVCPEGGAVTLTGTPANGTFSGTGVSGNTFNPSGFQQGMYSISYTATDNIGCITTAIKAIRVEKAPDAQDITECPESIIMLPTDASWGQVIWFSNSSLTNALDTTSIVSPSFTTPLLNQTTTYYLAGIREADIFYIDTLLETDSLVVDHDVITDDDRGGIAVTQNHVYIVGDSYAARYNLDLTNGTQLPMRDGLFSDLSTGKLYTLWDGTTDPVNVSGNFSVQALVELDSNLALTNNFVQLNAQLTLSDSYNGIFAGHGIVILFSSLDNHFYVINIASGNVVDLGVHGIPLYNSENWSAWGVAEYDGNSYSVVFRGDGENISRLNLTTDAITRAGQFNNLNDLASLTINPWNNRWYFHYEGSGQFGGSAETLGYADAAYTYSPTAGTLSCYSALTITINTVDLGPDTVICEGSSVVLFAGTGYTQYTWNGVTTNFNAVSATEQGVYDIEVRDNDGCFLYDTVNVIVNDAPNPTIDLGNSFIYCSDAAAVTLTASPANGTFSGAGITGSSFNPTTAGVGVHEITYTVTGNNGCAGSTMDYLVVENCTGIEDIALTELNVYPNPSTGLVNVQFGAQVSAATVTVYDLQGREVYNTSSLINNTIALNLSQIGSGVYQLRIAANGNTTTKRLVIQQ